jgi:ABC-type lipoprotein release transport system permease subunit
MGWIRIHLSRSAALFRGKKLDTDLDEELRAHIDLAIEENRLGTGVGFTMALIALRWVRSLLYQTSVMDPLAVGGSILLLWVAAAISAIVPARRGASTDPMRALRTE